MPFSVGCDLVAIARFVCWTAYSPARLATLYSPYECNRIAHLQQLITPSAPQEITQYLATRFAAKEAFYKALSQWLQFHGLTATTFSLRACAPLVSVESVGIWQLPTLIIDLPSLERLAGTTLPPFTAHVSLAHERTHALAYVALTGNP